MFKELTRHIMTIQELPEEILKEFLARWYEKHGGKKEIITYSNSIERYLYFTTKGVQKAYYVKDDKEYTVAFTYPYAFTCIPESFLTQKPSQYTFECLTESRFLRISYPDFFECVEKYPEVETLLRKALIGILGGVVNRYHRMLTLNMEERFRDFMKTSCSLINLIPHKEIANYLKIDPTNFSKLLNNIKI